MRVLKHSQGSVLIWIAELVGVMRESECGSVLLSHAKQQILDSTASCLVCFKENNRRTLCPFPQYIINIGILMILCTRGLSVTSSFVVLVWFVRSVIGIPTIS